MRRISLTIALAAIGVLALAGTASADIGDVRELSVNDPLFGTASEVEVAGTIRCQATIEFGLWVGVAQGENGGEAYEIFVQEDSGREITDDEASAEGVGAYGPNFDPPVGVSDDSPCSQSTQSWDVLVQQNRDSGDFITTENRPEELLEVLAVAGTSAEDGGRGPGPFIADILGLEEDFDFVRTR